MHHYGLQSMRSRVRARKLEFLQHVLDEECELQDVNCTVWWLQVVISGEEEQLLDRCENNTPITVEVDRWIDCGMAHWTWWWNTCIRGLQSLVWVMWHTMEEVVGLAHSVTKLLWRDLSWTTSYLSTGMLLIWSLRKWWSNWRYAVWYVIKGVACS